MFKLLHNSGRPTQNKSQNYANFIESKGELSPDLTAPLTSQSQLRKISTPLGLNSN